MTHALVANSLPIPSPLGSLDAYIGAVHQIPVLTVDDEQTLARRYRDDDDLDAAREVMPQGGAARDLVARHPEVGAIVLECTNMPPYAAAVQQATGLPVYDIYSLITWFHAGLRPRVF